MWRWKYGANVSWWWLLVPLCGMCVWAGTPNNHHHEWNNQDDQFFGDPWRKDMRQCNQKRTKSDPEPEPDPEDCFEEHPEIRFFCMIIYIYHG